MIEDLDNVCIDDLRNFGEIDDHALGWAGEEEWSVNCDLQAVGVAVEMSAFSEMVRQDVSGFEGEMFTDLHELRVRLRARKILNVNPKTAILCGACLGDDVPPARLGVVECAIGVGEKAAWINRVFLP